MSKLPFNLFQAVNDLEASQSLLRNRAYGVIEVCDQELKAVHLRPFPKLISTTEIQWSSFWKTPTFQPNTIDRVLLYYNQPMFHRNFLALKYFVSDYRSSLASIATCLSVLDYIAELKRTDAIVTEITNDRIKDRHLEHFGWEEHLKDASGRHWIKRFYGQYPERHLFQRSNTTHQTQRGQIRLKPKLHFPSIHSDSAVAKDSQSVTH